MRTIFGVLGLALLVLAGVLVVRGLLLPSQQVEVAPAPLLAVDANAVAQRLALAVRSRTISPQQSGRVDPRPFHELEGHLAAIYPRVHRSLERERIADLSLLYTWRGRNPDLAPVLLAAHLDVVPVDPASLGDWTHPPFEGVVEDGVVWGRGAIDDKAAVVCILEAVERLLAAGFRPQRTVLLAFGHDEEVGGDEGAAAIAQTLAERGTVLAWVLDEGGLVAEDFLPILDVPVAVVGIAEKGSVSIALEVEAPGGHSSAPPPSSAIGTLSSAVVALEAEPMPARVDGVVATFLAHLAPELPLWARSVLANRWLFDPVLVRFFSQSPPLDAMLRTTTAVTMFEAGVAENVLPIRARAVANFRIHPRDSVDAVRRHVKRTVDDNHVRITVGVRTTPREPSPVSPVAAQPFRLLQRTIAEVMPGVVTVPYLVIGGTDARHYQALTHNIYRFTPFVFGSEALRLAHGTNERIDGENLVLGVRFFERLLRNAVGPI